MGYETPAQSRIRRASNVEYRRAYRAAHRDEHVAYMRQYNKDNRDQLNDEARKNNRTLRGRYRMLRGNAASRNLAADITFDEYVGLVENGSCAYCDGALPEAGAGVDRKNSKLGYYVSNCVPCCTECNWIRGDDIVTHDEMFEVAKLLKKLRTK